MIFHVKTGEFFHAPFLHAFFRPPGFVGVDQLAELRAVIAEVVDPDDLIAEKSENAIQRRADHRGGKVSDMEGFRHVDGRVVDADRLSVSGFCGTVCGAFLRNFFQRVFRKPLAVYFEIEIAVYGSRAFDHVVGGKARREILCDSDGGFSHRLREFKTGESVIAHRSVRGNGDGGGDLFRGYAAIG